MGTPFAFARSLNSAAREFLEYSWLGGSGLRFPRTNPGFEVFLQVTDGKVARLFLLL